LGVDLIKIYECLCDRTRLRLLNVLAQGPVCVCHFQAVLGEPQVKISKHLGYLRERGLVECERHGNWVVYALPTKPSRELKANLACLQDCARENAVFKRDLARLKKIEPACAWVRAGEPEKAPGQVRCCC
jgi:ArsR family transcriptional regulator, arsenate/arsenite/antimonite-responsive transcriptional repressor